MGNNPSDIVTNTTTIINQASSTINVRTSATCYVTNSAINVINIDCVPSTEAIQNIIDGHLKCLELASEDSCERFYSSALETQLCQFGNITQVISYSFTGGCDISVDALSEMNVSMINEIAQKLDEADDVTAKLFGALSTDNTENTIDIANIINQSFDNQTHAEVFAIGVASNTINTTGTGIIADAITQDAKLSATFNGSIQSSAATNLAATIDNQASQILDKKTSGPFTALEAWAGAFEAIGTGWTSAFMIIGIVVVLAVIGVPIILMALKSASLKKRYAKKPKDDNSAGKEPEKEPEKQEKETVKESSQSEPTESPTPNLSPQEVDIDSLLDKL